MSKRFIFIIFSSLLCLPVFASQYTPDDLYQYRYLHLDNGLDLFLKPRQGAHNVAIRMVVHVGNYDFPCGRKETPHFLEHLLFAGTSKHSESELDSLIEDNGGHWNASTGGEKTIYQVDIHDQYTGLALDTLFEILTDSQFTKENVDRSRDIIHRESGGEPSSLRNWLYRHGIGRSAQDKVDELIWPPEFNCEELETARAIDRQAIVEAWRNYYVPNNMALVVVGNFDRASVLQQVRRSFGKLPSHPLPTQTAGAIPAVQRSEVEGTFAPILGTEAHVSLHYQTEGYRSDDVYSMILLNDLLNERMFRELRVRQGLAYGPDSSIGVDRRVGSVSLSADSELANIDKVKAEMLSLVEHLRQQGISAKELERVRRRVLLSYAQGYEDNSSIAGHYASLWKRFEHGGRFVDLETKLSAIGSRQLSSYARRILDPAKVVIAVSKPTISYHRLYTLLGVMVLLLAVVLGWYAWRRRRPGS